MSSFHQSVLARWIVSVIVLTAFGWVWLTHIEVVRKAEAREVSNRFSLHLLQRFHQTLGPVFMMATHVDQKSGKIESFEEYAGGLLRDFPLVRALELAPGGVVTRVYPLRGNEAIVGHDLLIDKNRNKEAYQAVSRRQLVVAGPLKLMQGGIGVVARYPIFLVAPDGRDSFWGFSIGIIDFPALMRIAGEAEFARRGYQYQMCWVPYGETECKLVLGDQDMSAAEPVISKLSPPAAEWRLAVVATGGWITLVDRLLVLLSILLGSAGVVALSFFSISAKAEKKSDLKKSSLPAGQAGQAGKALN